MTALYALPDPPERRPKPAAKAMRAPERLSFVYQRMVEAELSPRTVKLYMEELRRAEFWCEEAGYTLRNVHGEVLAEYVSTRPKSNSTRMMIRCALQHYWRAFDRKHPPLWAIRVPKAPRMVCRALTEEEAHRLATVAQRRGDKQGLAVMLAMYLGLRREEVASIAWDDLTDDGWLKVIGKGDVTATLPVHPIVLDALANLPREHPRWVFPALARRRLATIGHVHPATVWAWVKVVALEAGLDNVSTHRLRHSALATANDATGDLRAVQAFARHAKPETTAGYTRATERRLRAVMEAIDYAMPTEED